MALSNNSSNPDKKTTTPRKTGAAQKKSPAKKKSSGPKKSTAAIKKVSSAPTARPEKKITTIVARVDVGFGNELYLRGEGGGLNWHEGIVMNCLGEDEWTWSTFSATEAIVFKFLLNDRIWSLGEDLTVPAGGKSVCTPRF